MIKIDDYLTHVEHEEDLKYLKTPLLDVNMRLFKNPQNKHYKRLIRQCCNLVRMVALSDFEDYKKPHGMSGANLAIPFNIIGIVRNRNTKEEWCEIMINPKITWKSQKKSESWTNCGSIRLKDPIKVERHIGITLDWIDEKGNEQKKTFSPHNQAATIQHEVEHNLGILVTDLEIKQIINETT